jgi:hypothetical protein
VEYIGKSKQLQEITWATIQSNVGLLAKEAEADIPNSPYMHYRIKIT